MTEGESPAPSASGPDLSGRAVDGYRIECLLGRGGMGEVYKAYDTNLERHVALKIVSAADALDRELVLRFEREVRSASGLSHPHLDHIHASRSIRPSMKTSPRASTVCFGERYELQPSQLRDGWGGEIRYERSAPQRFRLTSAGLDRSFGTKDDIVIENGIVVSGEMELPIGPAGRR